MWQKFFESCLMMWKEMVILSGLTHETNPLLVIMAIVNSILCYNNDTTTIDLTRKIGNLHCVLP